MRIILAIKSAVSRREWEKRLEAAPGIEVEKVATSLTEVYHEAEHRPTRAVMLCRDMMERPEFEVLSHLLNALRIRVAVLNSRPFSGSPIQYRFCKSPVVELSDSMSDDEILHALLARDNSDVLKNKSRVELGRVKSASGRGRIIFLGASTGGVDALIKVLSDFPEHCPPTFIVQHTGGNFSGGLARLLNSRCSARVLEAEEKMVMTNGMVAIAPGDSHHLELQRSGEKLLCRLRKAPVVCGHRPSVDALFLSGVSVADRIAAAILTGMGKDGADGLLALRKAGSVTFGQNEETSLVYGMPKVAMEIGAVMHQLPLEKIGPALIEASAERRVA